MYSMLPAVEHWLITVNKYHHRAYHGAPVMVIAVIILCVIIWACWQDIVSMKCTISTEEQKNTTALSISHIYILHTSAHKVSPPAELHALKVSSWFSVKAQK